MPSSVFVHTHRVSYADCTVGNHVYYSRYLEILESARGEFFRHLDASFAALQEQGSIFPVTRVELRYRAAARYDDLLAVELQVERAERVRLDFVYRIVAPRNRLLVEARSEHVCTDVADKAKRLPVGLLSALEPYRLGLGPDCK
jgi:acyl-CoA thioester hydrolase